MNSVLAGIKERQDLADYIASNAGSLMVDLYHKQLKQEQKELNDYVSELDKNIEAMALKCVRQAFPDDSFYSEEGSEFVSTSKYEWIVDPIDGTNNYLRGLPLCGFQLAILYAGEPVYGLIHRPLTQEIFTATKGEGAYYKNILTGKNARIEVSGRPINQAIAIFDAQVGKKDNPSTKIMLKLADKINAVRVLGAAVFDLPAVACGSIELLVTGIAKKYDIAAGKLLIEEAGGTVYNTKGEETSLEDDLMIFSSKQLKPSILNAIEEAGV